jgi:hypothetical protein
MGKQPHGTPEANVIKEILKLLQGFLQDHPLVVFFSLLVVIVLLILRLVGLF